MTSNPLLARQVQINEEDIALLKKQRVEDVKDLVDKIDKLGKVDMDDSSTTVNNNPSYYTSVVSYEIKACESVGLNALKLFTGVQYAYVHTYKSVSETVDIDTYQQVFAISTDGKLITAYRVAGDADTWGTWETGLADNAGGPGSGSGGAGTVSPTQPSDQNENDFWYEPIEAKNDPAETVSN